MYIQITTKKRNGKTYSYPLLCKKFRKDGKIKTEVIANLTKFPKDIILAITNCLKKDIGLQVSLNDISVSKSVDYGFVCVLIALLKELRISETLEKTLDREQSKLSQLMIIGKIITRGSKLGIFNWINRNPDIAEKFEIDLNTLKLNDFYDTLEDVSNIQPRIEQKWNVYHKSNNEIFLYDITSSYFEGVKNEMAEYGYNRDGKKGKKQIVIGLITTNTGFPLSIEVFEGNQNDHKTVIGQLQKIKNNFRADSIVFIGDRGMKIRYNLDLMDDADKKGIHYITGLSLDEIQGLIKQETIQLNLFSKDIAEIETKDNIRYVLCTNPILAEVQTATRLALKSKLISKLEIIETSFTKELERVQSNKIRTENGDKNKKLVTVFNDKKLDNYKYRTRKVIEKYNMQSFYTVVITSTSFEIQFNEENYTRSDEFDGKYVFVTNVEKEKMSKENIRKEYKNLQNVEHAFRDMKTSKLDIRPIFLIKEKTTKGHILLSMFSYAIIKTMEDRVFPWLEQYNKEHQKKLSFKDVEEELKAIKKTEIQIGENYNKLMVSQLTKIQTEISNALKIKIE